MILQGLLDNFHGRGKILKWGFPDSQLRSFPSAWLVSMSFVSSQSDLVGLKICSPKRVFKKDVNLNFLLS